MISTIYVNAGHIGYAYIHVGYGMAYY